MDRPSLDVSKSDVTSFGHTPLTASYTEEERLTDAAQFETRLVEYLMDHDGFWKKDECKLQHCFAGKQSESAFVAVEVRAPIRSIRPDKRILAHANEDN